jgi:hypothetical protein
MGAAAPAAMKLSRLALMIVLKVAGTMVSWVTEQLENSPRRGVFAARNTPHPASLAMNAGTEKY